MRDGVLGSNSIPSRFAFLALWSSEVTAKACGKTNKEIGEKEQVSEQSVSGGLVRVHGKRGVSVLGIEALTLTQDP